jgi:assimilatory nitrate reductase catalytic subunit
VAESADGVQVTGNAAFPVNRGQLCIKGWTAAATLRHPERLTSPLVRGASGALEATTWDQALSYVATKLRETQARFGADSVGVFGSGALTNEKAYLLGKFARVALRTRNVDYNGRFCMSSAASAATRALGIDRGLPFPLEDLARTQLLLVVGANVAECMPPLMQYLESQRANGGKLVLVDPRRSPTGQGATLHLPLTPGSDAALANGLLHILIRDSLIDQDYIDARTEGFERLKASVASYWPERVERITGIAEAQLIEAARLLGLAKTAIILSGRGPEQQIQGVGNSLAFINLALALGLVGKPLSGYGTLTGQGNGQGGREHGQKADQLPGYRSIGDPIARRQVARVWNVQEESIPGPGLPAYQMFASSGEPGGLKALLVFGSNLAVSAPDGHRIEQMLRSLDFLMVVDFFLSETAALADVVLPSAQWAEEDGTVTNLEGRVILRRRAVQPPAGVKTDVEILCALAGQLGEKNRFTYDGPRQVFDELRRASAGGGADYSGISYEKIEALGGVFWPCPSEEHQGTPRLFAERFPTSSGRARFHPVSHLPPAEQPDSEYPLYLTTGRVLAHYQSGTQTRRIAALQELAPRATAQMHPRVAQKHALADGDQVTLSSRRGSARLIVETTPLIREDTIFVPFHWGGVQSANRLTHAATDPISGMPEFKVCAVRVEGGHSVAEGRFP